MIIRQIQLEEAASFIALVKTIEKSGFMLYEPEERSTSIEDQEQAIVNIKK